MEHYHIEMETESEPKSKHNIKSNSKKITSKNEINESKIKNNNFFSKNDENKGKAIEIKNYLYNMIHNYFIYISMIFLFLYYYLFLGIILFLILHFGDNNQIDNNIEKDKGIVQLIKENEKGEIEIKKELLKSVNSFIACIGSPGTGKSTFSSNYYKILYNVKNDYFESSNNYITFTKGIWMISEEERRKIPKYIEKDILDVEGFEIDKSKSWKYIMVIALLSNDLIILNRNQRYDEVQKVIKIIQIGLKKMQEKNIPRILKRIYIQTTIINPQPIEELLNLFD